MVMLIRDRRYFIFLLFVEKAKDSYTYWHFEEGSNIIKVFIWVPKIVQGLYQPLPPLLWPPEAYKVDFFEFSRQFLNFRAFFCIFPIFIWLVRFPPSFIKIAS